MPAMTEEQFKEALPVQVRKSVTPEVMQSINAALGDPEAMEAFKENLVSYTSVLLEGRFKMGNYVNAVKYVSFKLLGSTNKDAYTRTFPGKIQAFKASGLDDRTISSYISAYHKSKLVNLIMAQTLVPTHVLNAPYFQQAINTQAELMMTASSEKVRCDAANSLLSHLKPPETRKVELDLGHKADKTLDSLRATTRELVRQQKKMLEEGSTRLKDVAEGALIVVRD